MALTDRPLVWLEGKVKSPSFSAEARVEAGYLLRLLQRGQKLRLPHSRPMPTIGPRCHELRVHDRNLTWRIVYRVDPDAVVVMDVFEKKSQQTPDRVVQTCRARLKSYDEMSAP